MLHICIFNAWYTLLVWLLLVFLTPSEAAEVSCSHHVNRGYFNHAFCSKVNATLRCASNNLKTLFASNIVCYSFCFFVLQVFSMLRKVTKLYVFRILMSFWSPFNEHDTFVRFPFSSLYFNLLSLAKSICFKRLPKIRVVISVAARF